MEQLINEDWYKNIFRLINSARPESGAELKKICDDLATIYEAKGISEYWPPNIPGDSAQTPTGEGGSNPEFVPVSARKFEKPIAPIRKDSLAADRSSPHLASLRSNSPRLSSVSVASASAAADVNTSKSSSVVPDDQSQSDISDTLINASADTNSADDSPSSSSITVPSITISGGGLSESSKRKTSADDVDQSIDAGDEQESAKKREDRRTKSDDTPPSWAEFEPPEKKAKIAVVESVKDATPAKSSQVKTEPMEMHGDFEALTCVACKTFQLASDNFLVECHECHNMYHQKCHQPNVPKSQISDPRLLWYCLQCEKKNRNRADTSAVTVKPMGNSGTSGRRNTATAAASATRDEKKHGDKSNAFKRSGTMEAKEKQAQSNAASWVPSSASKQSTALTPGLISMAEKFFEKHKKKTVASPPQKPSSSTGTTNPFAMALSSAASNSTGLAKLAQSTTTTTSGLSKLAGTVQQQNASASGKSQSIGASASASAAASAAAAAAAANSNSRSLPASSSQQMQAAAEKRLLMMKKKAAQKGTFKL